MELRNAMARIHRISCNRLDVDFNKTLTKSQKREITQARQATMSATKEIFVNKTLAEIGSALFFKDHATVLHAKKTVNNLCDTDKKFRSDYNYILKTAKKQLGLKPKREIILTPEEIIIQVKKLIFKGCDIHTAIEINSLLFEL